jgi:hypothetical protein
MIARAIRDQLAATMEGNPIVSASRFSWAEA